MGDILEVNTLSQKLLNELTTLLAEKSPILIGSILVLIIGWKLINVIINLEKKAFQKFDVEPLISSFLSNFSLWTLRLLLLLSCASMLGVQTTSFLAILGSAGLAIGLALQGSLSNLAGGVLILILKPFKVGHFIEAQGHSGYVKNIHLFHTQLNTLDNRLVMLPNGLLASGSLMNYSAEPIRRIDFTIGISYGDDLKKAKSILLDLARQDSRILNDPEPESMVNALADSEVTMLLRIWTKTEDYWPVLFDLRENAKLSFDENHITIPFPQREVYLNSK